MRTLGLCLLFSLAAGSAELNLMPMPAKVSMGFGRLKIDETFGVSLTGYREPRLERAAARLMDQVGAKTGIMFRGGAALEIHCAGAGEDESYRLEVGGSGAKITATAPPGALRGMATFFQLVDSGPQEFSVPQLTIDDTPRFPWRGALLDVSRHWMTVEVVKRTLDGMAAVKLNVFHWHLSDDQGFRVESRRYPKLHERGSDGHYYTQEQVKEIIEYARDRGIRVIPEFDMPGHSTSWFAGYPELASAPGPYEIARRMGVLDACIDPTREEVYQFLDGFIGEMAALFPDEYFHIGGDEVNGKQWSANARIQAFMREHGLSDNHALQAFFNRRVLTIVQAHEKKMIGWDEILHPDLPKNIVVQSWRGQKSLAEAARLGYMGILSFGYYLDLMQPAWAHYGVDPLGGDAAGLNAEQAARVLGGEACEWSEYVTPENVDSRIWPRAAVIAERLWSPQDVKDVDSMYRRLAAISRDLEWLGLRHLSSQRRMLERLAGPHPVEPLAVLASVLEPVKEYAREDMHKYTTFTPLNRLVDAAQPESYPAREFMRMVDRFLADRASVNTEPISRRLILWRDNDPALDSFLLREDVPLSRDLSAAASAGLRALDILQHGQHAPAGWVGEQMELLKNAREPRAELLIMVIRPIQKLVEAAR